MFQSLRFNWTEIYEFFYYNPDRELSYPTYGLPIELPVFLHKSNTGLLEGAIEQYRDNQEYNSLHLRIYPNRIKIQMDKANPEFHPVEHVVLDFKTIINSQTIQKTICVGGVLLFLGLALRSRA